MQFIFQSYGAMIECSRGRLFGLILNTVEAQSVLISRIISKVYTKLHNT